VKQSSVDTGRSVREKVKCLRRIAHQLTCHLTLEISKSFSILQDITQKQGDTHTYKKKI